MASSCQPFLAQVLETEVTVWYLKNCLYVRLELYNFMPADFGNRSKQLILYLFIRSVLKFRSAFARNIECVSVGGSN
jgi:hypothetical protein